MRTLTAIMTASILTACASYPAQDSVSTLHDRLLTLDTHVDIPLDYMQAVDPGAETNLQVDLGKLDAGKLDVAFFIVYTPQAEMTDAAYAEAQNIAKTRLSAIHAMMKAYPNEIALAETANEAEDIVARGRKVALIGMENAFPLGESTDMQDWVDKGIRYVGITHFGHNQFGDSSNPHSERDNGPRWEGLSPLGKDLIKVLNESGVMIDVSHAAKSTMMQAADLSRSPIIASHSGAKAMADSARNLDDEQLRKIAEVGGVAHMVALDVYVKPLTAEQEAYREGVRRDMGLETAESRRNMTPEVEAEYEKRVAGMWDIEPRATVADFVDHIDHAVKIAGIDHVGIASDFDGGGGITGWEDASDTENVTRELVRRGYSEADIAKIWGGNLLRVMRAAEMVAQP